MDVETEEALKHMGADYAGGALRFFEDQRTGSAALGELAVFFGTASAEMLATMYDILNRHAGPADAEAWLVRTLSLVAAKARLKGVPGTLGFKVSVADGAVKPPGP